MGARWLQPTIVGSVSCNSPESSVIWEHTDPPTGHICVDTMYVVNGRACD